MPTGSVVATDSVSRNVKLFKEYAQKRIHI